MPRRVTLGGEGIARFGGGRRAVGPGRRSIPYATRAVTSKRPQTPRGVFIPEDKNVDSINRPAGRRRPPTYVALADEP